MIKIKCAFEKKLPSTVYFSGVSEEGNAQQGHQLSKKSITKENLSVIANKIIKSAFLLNQQANICHVVLRDHQIPFLNEIFKLLTIDITTEEDGILQNFKISSRSTQIRLFTEDLVKQSRKQIDAMMQEDKEKILDSFKTQK